MVEMLKSDIKKLAYLDNNYIIINPSENRFKGNLIDLNHLPLVSFCIPTKNNESTIENCLKSIKMQNYPSFEIIIIDGNSSDQTIKIAEKYADKILIDAGTYGSACQTGFEASSGEIIALIDSDIIIPHKNWLFNAVKFFNFSNKVSSVWPLCEAPQGASSFARLYQTYLHKIFIENRIKKSIGYFGGGNTLFQKKVLLEIGGIDRSIHWGADFDWAKKMKDKGYTVVFIYDPLYHDTMRTFRLFYRKQFFGANTFVKRGFQFMGLTTKEILYEHFILGTKAMIKGIIIDRDPAWIYFPFVVLVRVMAYGYILISSGESSNGGEKIF
jgi:glycosyltransferase involved in cell wall biosynthesis